jgi:hypothetical protein
VGKTHTSSRRHRRRGRLPRMRSKRYGMLAAVWAILASVFAIAWWTTAGALWLVAALLGGLVAVMAAIATFDPDTAVPGSGAKNPPKPNPRGNAPRGGSRGGPGTAGAKQRKQTCSARCRNSAEDVSICRCICGGKTHGIARRTL